MQTKFRTYVSHRMLPAIYQPNLLQICRQFSHYNFQINLTRMTAQVYECDALLQIDIRYILYNFTPYNYNQMKKCWANQSLHQSGLLVAL